MGIQHKILYESLEMTRGICTIDVSWNTTNGVLSGLQIVDVAVAK